uniref:DNA2/NAM7 helicase-like C-terminal domain-containing protein n=1 Tax=Romanomermis culicivorax TaxID=13658 RepID=A0A915IVJ5_ROMCU
MHIPYMLLNQQYQMHSVIGSIVSDLMYGNRVQKCTKKVIEDHILPLPESFLTMMTGYSIAWIHIATEESVDKNSRSMQNIGEAIACINLAASLIGQHKMCSDHIIIIMSYSTQGQESNIVIYDIVWSNQYLIIGFLENFKCLNVAIS